MLSSFLSSYWLQKNQIPVAVVAFMCTLYIIVRPYLHPTKIVRRKELSARMQEMKNKASRHDPFSEEDLDVAVRSFQYASGNFSNKMLSSKVAEDIDWMCLRGLISQVASKTHKDWSVTERAADLLGDLIGTPQTSATCCRLLRRVLDEGGWGAAEDHASARIARHNRCVAADIGPSSLGHRKALKEQALPHDPSAHRPWAVVVCGLNGIRKTTSVYQPWFPQLLLSALGSQFGGSAEDLPCGGNSFFRQLDHLVATVACEDFRELYERAGLVSVAEYCQVKEAIFARYRTLAELVGMLLLKEARLKGLNVMVETSGRDVASFRYIDHLFPSSCGERGGSSVRRDYNKLIVHFTIDEIGLAEQSVDQRMLKEMRAGEAALRGASYVDDATVRRVIGVNQGGPYGSSVLNQVQEESDAVMNKIFDGEQSDDDEFGDWYKARICIRASAGGWRAAVGGAAADGQHASASALSFSFENEEIRVEDDCL